MLLQIPTPLTLFSPMLVTRILDADFQFAISEIKRDISSLIGKDIRNPIIHFESVQSV